MDKKKKIGLISFAVVIIVIMLLSLLGGINDSIGMSIALALAIVFDAIVAVNAFKHDVKFMGYLMVVFGVIGVILLIFSILGYLKMNKVGDYKFQVTLDTNQSEKKLLFNYDGYNYYTYNTENVNIILKSDGKTYPLETALNDKLITLDEILSLAVPNEGTVGYKIYYDGGQKKYSNDEYSIIVCENEKKDVIFSTFNYTFDTSMCTD